MTKVKAKNVFVCAYMDPRIPAHQGQEDIVRRFPLAITSQRDLAEDRAFRDRVLELNPAQKMLGYFHGTVRMPRPGAGHQRLMALPPESCITVNGVTPLVKGYPLFDPRNVQWQEAFIEACEMSYDVYRHWVGLFLDDLTVFNIAHPDPVIRREMREALQATLLRLRVRMPSAVLIGNGSEHWRGLNGEMVEGRLSDWAEELKPHVGQSKPRYDLAMYINPELTPASIRRQMEFAHSHGAWFGACANYQTAMWYDFYEEAA